MDGFFFSLSNYKAGFLRLWGETVILSGFVSQEIRVAQCPHLFEIMARKELPQAPFPAEGCWSCSHVLDFLDHLELGSCCMRPRLAVAS